MTAPPFISLPVPETVTMMPSGSGSQAMTSGFAQYFSQISSSETAASEIALQQSMTLPPPTARIMSACSALASFAPSSTLA